LSVLGIRGRTASTEPELDKATRRHLQGPRERHSHLVTGGPPSRRWSLISGTQPPQARHSRHASMRIPTGFEPVTYAVGEIALSALKPWPRSVMKCGAA